MVHRVLVRHGCNWLRWLDRPTGRPIRRYEHPRPGDLVHLDVKKLGRIPSGGGHRGHSLHAISVIRVLTDNGIGYRSRVFRTALADGGVRHRRTRPYRPQTNRRWSGSTAPCWRSGPTGGCTAQMPPATAPCSPGSTGTTISEPTPPSEADHLSAALTTFLVTTTGRFVDRDAGMDGRYRP